MANPAVWHKLVPIIDAIPGRMRPRRFAIHGRDMTQRKMQTFLLAASLLACGNLPVNAQGAALVLRDQARQRDVPIEIRLPEAPQGCTPDAHCGVAFISPGYGLSHNDYRFVSDALSGIGYMVVSIQSVLPGDPQAPDTGNIVADRTPMWSIGADNLRYVKDALSGLFPAYDWSRLVLVGHSNGGDLSALALEQTPSLASTLITLDNRRHPLPRSAGVGLLSIRGSDFEADPGVLPSPEELQPASRCIVEIPNSRHNDMNDAGPAWLKERISSLVVGFLKHDRCGI